MQHQSAPNWVPSYDQSHLAALDVVFFPAARKTAEKLPGFVSTAHLTLQMLL